MPVIDVFDDVLKAPNEYLSAALSQPFQTMTFGPVSFHGIALPPMPDFTDWLLERALRPSVSFVRRSPVGQVEPHYIHSDADMGQWTAILYLNPQPVTDDGTRFWKHRDSGAIEGESVSADDGHRLDQWHCYRHVEAQFNRCVVFDARLFHSRSLLENYGSDGSARLVQVAFGQWGAH